MGRSRLLGAHRAAPPGATGQLFNARLREGSGTRTRGASRKAGKTSIAERAPRHREAGAGRPAQHNKAEERTEDARLSGAGGRRGARGPGFLRQTRTWQVGQLQAPRPAPCCPRSDSTAGPAHPDPDPLQNAPPPAR